MKFDRRNDPYAGSFQPACVAQPDGPSQYTDKDGNILTRRDRGVYPFHRRTKSVWTTDPEGNIRYTTTEPDGTVIKYYTTPEGETILEV